MFLSGVSLHGTARGFNGAISSGSTAPPTTQPYHNMGCSLSSADPWHHICTRMDFHPGLSKIKAFRACFLPVPPLSDCISPQLSFPSFCCGFFFFFSLLQESNGEGAWNRQRSCLGSAASQQLSAAPRGDERVSHSLSSQLKHLSLHENLSPALPGLLSTQKKGRDWGFGGYASCAG